jgi:hypothetical protein
MTPNRPDPWSAVTAARLPADGLAALAPVRSRADVRVQLAGAVAWVRWPAGQPDVVRHLLPVEGVAFFTHRDGAWFPFGRLVPTADAPPDADGLPVAAVIAPQRFEASAPEPPAWAPVAIGVVRGGEPRPATALACPVGELLRWADTATTAELSAVRAARAGGRALLLGRRLPVISTAVRYWGDKVLVPLGFRVEPDLPDAVLREAAGVVAPEELLVLDEGGAEVVPLAAFEPVTRAGVRLGVRPGGHAE